MLQLVTCPIEQNQNIIFKVYPERWWLLLTVVLLNLANYSHWVAFPSVAKNAAKYYDQVFFFFLACSPLIITPLWWGPYPFRVSSYLGHVTSISGTLLQVMMVVLGCSVGCSRFGQQSILFSQEDLFVLGLVPFFSEVACSTTVIPKKSDFRGCDILQHFSEPGCQI